MIFMTQPKCLMWTVQKCSLVSHSFCAEIHALLVFQTDWWAGNSWGVYLHKSFRKNLSAHTNTFFSYLTSIYNRPPRKPELTSMRNQINFQTKVQIFIILQRFVWTFKPPKHLLKKRIAMQKHLPFNPYTLESDARIRSSDSELKYWRAGTLTLEDLHLYANPHLVCNKNNLFDMYHDNKACELC